MIENSVTIIIGGLFLTVSRFRAGIYCRVSKDELGKHEIWDLNSSEEMLNSSIQSQIVLMEHYIHMQKDMKQIKVYVDEGYSGSNFERPGFLEMKKDIEAGIINTVIVKDVSRLGREHIDTDYYIEKYFPEKGVRFISVLDLADSFGDAKEEMLQIKNLLNDMYLRDISAKIKSVIRMKRRAGEYTQGQAPYGYVKSREKKNYLEVDPYASEVVKRIYERYIQGKGYGSIAKELNEEGILSPGAYKKERDSSYPYQTGSGKWEKSSVRDILNNPVYTGSVVSLKREKLSFKLKKQRTIPLGQRELNAGTHKPIISHADYIRVQLRREGH